MADEAYADPWTWIRTEYSVLIIVHGVSPFNIDLGDDDTTAAGAAPNDDF